MRLGKMIVCAAVLLSISTLNAAEPSGLPPWQDNRVGISSEVLGPWMPITTAENRIGVWGRTYRFGAVALPASVVARDAQILDGPIILTGSAGGKPLVWKAAEDSVLFEYALR